MKHGEITGEILRSFYDVYNTLGFGFIESVYHRAMMIALNQAGLHAELKVRVPVHFRGHVVGDFIPDIIVNGLVIVELKAVDGDHNWHVAQVLNYLKASSIEVGMLLIFGQTPTFSRYYLDNDRKRLRPAIHESDESHG